MQKLLKYKECMFLTFIVWSGLTASLSAQKDFLGGGVVKNNPIFVKQILLHHIYAIIWEFIWTKCVTHLLVFLI